MPVRPPAAGVMKHQIMFARGSDVEVMTIWTYKATTADWSVRRADELAILRNWVQTQWKSAANTGIAATGIKSWRMDTTLPTKFADSPFSPVETGTRTGAGAGPAPGVLAAVVSLRTQAVGASVRGINGHIAWPGLCVDQYTDDQLLSGAQTLILGRMNALRTAMTAGAGGTAQGSWCIVSYVDGGTRTTPVYRTTPVPLVIDHLLIRPTLGVQRRRRLRFNSYPVGS